ncbi:hypothetical protein GCM10010885_17800 [Alicyclobacillus cellulosilyticus]|uniref:TIGR00725 family protein n=2 Tax=Alicyclobacillus cellulosilyticus TaxID=1003997 RepID=A0A917KCM2_9BACL|nr:hypothetical protein GCM10010885_17800 [Alicyclobacillus cellulosilyticus]
MIRIGVIGQSGEVSAAVWAMAEALGQEIARQGCVLLTGGTNGVMEAVSRGAKAAGGLVVGILPGDDPGMANPYIDIPITTGFGFDYRSLVLVHSSDVVIMVAGGNGTLGELSAAYLNRRPVIVLEPSGGWAARIKQVVYDGRYLDTRRTVALDFVQTAEEAVQRAMALARQARCAWPSEQAKWKADG